LPAEPVKQAAPKKQTRIFGQSVWAFLLLTTFVVSSVCGVYLTLKPVNACDTPQTAAEEKSDNASSFSRNKKGKGEVAWIKVRGVIAQDNNSSPFSAPSGASAVAKKIREAGEDKDIKAIVLDINSPGGTVASVQNIYSEILKAKKDKKVVAIFRDVAASGGFYIAMAADKIVAEPGTITGSVGVIMQASNVEGLFDKIGIKVTPITSGKYKDIGSAYRPMSDAEKALLQDMVDDTYTQFFAAVKAGRPNVAADVLTEYTDGRIFTGQRAYNLGFVDKLGGEEEALQLAGELAGIKDPKIVSSRSEDFREFLFSMGSSLDNKSFVKQLESLATPSVAYLWVQ
jgi:protease-4